MKILYNKIGVYLDLLNGFRRRKLADIADIGILPCGYKETNAPLPDPALFTPYDTNGTWGNGPDTHAFFHFFVDVPADADTASVFVNVITDKKQTVDEKKSGWDPNNPQFIAYVDGIIVQGLDHNHTTFPIKSAGRHEVYLYAYTGIKVCSSNLALELIEINRDAEKLWYDIGVPYDALSILSTYSGEYRKILTALDDALLLLDVYEVPSDAFFASIKVACKYMEEEFYGKLCSPAGNGDPAVVGIGHTHIDCAWLWTLKQTREKVQRSFSTVLELMEQFPEYRFMSSQAFLYQNLKEEAPEVYQKIKEKIAEGKWECEGAMWVEADCNLSSGESLVRQVLYGKRFFKQEFGVDNRVLWLPDVFGYSAALPQILKKSGVDWFVTSKISWNERNKMPYDTFLWKGIDGTGINSYFLTAQNKKLGEGPKNYTTYVGMMTPAMVAGTYERYQQKELSDETILTYGFGDGGGGPTTDHLEVARRLSRGIPGVPTLRHGFAGDFLKRLEKRIEGNSRLPVWSGELYLEFHRATYTTQVKNKKNNRQSEALYLGAEWLSSMAGVLCDREFPKAELHRGWEMILTNQFHDIIPGSSIREVYDQCDLDYAEIRRIGTKAASDAAHAIADGIDQKNGYVVFNPNPTRGKGMLKLGGRTVYTEGIPAKGYACRDDFTTDNQVIVTERRMENERFILTFDGDMMISSLYDKQVQREIVKPYERANELRLYADRPYKYDAWEWNDYSLAKYEVINNVASVETLTDGVRAGVRIKRQFRKSALTQTIWMTDVSDRIDFETEIDWHERHQMLKAAFPLDINSQRATYEIQYGTTERPTHKNTSWDSAKFEVCGHRFADLSEGDYGVAMLNDCKYGHDIHDGVMTLSLIRGPEYPDPTADMGISTFTYSILPHKGAANIPALYEEAYALNSPMVAIAASGKKSVLPEDFALVSVNRENVLCEVVKEAEDGEDMIVRLFECNNTRTVADITFGFDVKEVLLCNMSEEEQTVLPRSKNTVRLKFGAFEIHTLKIKR